MHYGVHEREDDIEMGEIDYRSRKNPAAFRLSTCDVSIKLSHITLVNRSKVIFNLLLRRNV